MNTILDKLQNVQKTGKNQYKALCPAHDDKNPSLSIKIGNDKVLLYCHTANCKTKDIVKAIGLKMSDLNINNDITQKTMRRCDTKKSDSNGVTLKQYSKHKKIPQKFLKKVGASIGSFNGKKCVEFPYFDVDGNTVSTRLRTALKGTDKFKWNKGDKPCLYGLNRLNKSKKQSIFIVEGESDCHTLWFNKLPALGVPGVTNWKEDRDAQHPDSYETVYVIYEQDHGGDTLLATLKDSAIASKAKVVTLGKFKDVSEMLIATKKKFKTTFKKQFKKRLKKAVDKAVALNDFVAPAIQKKQAELFDKCQDIIKHDNILDLFCKDLHKCGVVGEEQYAKTMFLAFNTRFFSKLVSIIVRGASSSGKSYIIEQILKYFFPDYICRVMTSMSPKALYYTDEEFSHRFIWILEQTGINSKDLDYQVRTLISEGHLIYETTIKGDDGNFTTQKIEKEGPTGFIVTTTRIKFNEENENRCLTINTDDSSEQSKKVIKAIANNNDKNINMSKWVRFHEWLEHAGHRVVVPYAGVLAELIDSKSTRVRRDFKKIHLLIESNAIIHQYNRKRDSKGRIIASFKDYKAVRTLINKPLSTSMDKAISVPIKETVNAVKKLLKKKERISDDDRGVTCADLEKVLEVGKSQVHRRISEAESLGYLENIEDRPRAKKRLLIKEKLPKDKALMPSVKNLKAHFNKAKK